MACNCILSGVGGQGTILASKLIAQASMTKGLEVRTAETIGMAQRGGCVVSHVRTGTGIHSPMVSKHQADILLAFEPAEAVRCLPFLKDDGVVIVSSKGIPPVTSSLGGAVYDPQAMIDFLREKVQTVIVIDADEAAKACGSSKALNVVLLGAACASGRLGLTLDEMQAAIESRVASRFIEMNSKALAAGAAYASEQKERQDPGNENEAGTI